MRFGRLFLVVALLICGIEIIRLWGIVPGPQMAAHFNIQGEPDRFVSKMEFFWFQVQTLLIVLGVGILLQALISFVPAEMVNMPNREYWLAPERRNATMDRFGSFTAFMSGVMLLAVHAGFEFAAYANLASPIHFNAQGMMIVMVAVFIGIGIMLVQFMISFRIPPA